jgi:VWFA-related protein
VHDDWFGMPRASRTFLLEAQGAMKAPVRAVLVALLVGVTAPLSARPGQEPAPVFKSESNLVVLHVNVFNGRSDAVPNLPQTAFHVTEDDRPQAITFFSNEDVPVAVGLVIDNSGSMIARRSMVLAGTRAFAASSHPEDELFTIVFNEHVRHGLPDTIAFTRNRVQIEAGLNRFAPGGQTALHDAVIAGLEHLQEAAHQKRVLVVLSDGDDNASQHSSETMLERAGRSDALIYTVSTADLDTGVGDTRLLRKLAELSGGAAYRPDSEKEVVEAFTAIAENIRRGYSIGYTPTNTSPDGRFRRVKVTVRAPGFNNLTVSARDGYLAPRHLATQ